MPLPMVMALTVRSEAGGGRDAFPGESELAEGRESGGDSELAEWRLGVAWRNYRDGKCADRRFLGVGR